MSSHQHDTGVPGDIAAEKPDAPAPLVSVLMPVYNGQAYLEGAIDSILAQTLSDFEFVIIDDGSTDDTANILNRYEAADHRIRLHRNRENMGIIRSLNLGLKLCRGEFVARMDQDDISLPHRLERQVVFMRGRPGLSISSSTVQMFGARSYVWAPPGHHDEIMAALLFGNCLCHPAIIMRRQDLVAKGLEYPDVLYAEDYMLWCQGAAACRLGGQDELLVKYRIHDNAVSSRYRDQQMESEAAGWQYLVRTVLGMDASEGEFSAHEKLVRRLQGVDAGLTRQDIAWVKKLLDSARGMRMFAYLFWKLNHIVWKLPVSTGPDSSHIVRSFVFSVWKAFRLLPGSWRENLLWQLFLMRSKL